MKSRALAVLVVFLLTLATSVSGVVSPVGVVPDRLFYVALGASDAVGIGAIPIDRGYVFRIEDALDARLPTVDLLNLGIPGAMADDIFRVLELVLRIGIQPDLVTLWTGANELIGGEDPAVFEAELEAILAELTIRTDALVVIADLPDLTRLPRFVAEPRASVTPERVADFNQAIDRQALAAGALLVRLSQLPITDDLSSDLDGFHPSTEGHLQIAQAFLAVILPAFGLNQDAGDTLADSFQLKE
jgi:lysophospholipase L1-like esterase